jgi:4-hydroxy 2-oxovalerate aldolase
MIDYGTCALSRIRPRAESVLDGIRVIFKKHSMEKALLFCAELKARGYLVFVQPVSITEYTDRDLAHLAQLANELSPFALSIVDTYGLLHDEALLRYFSFFDRALAPDIMLGYHAHNNLQLAFSNCTALTRYATASKNPRTLLLDGSLLGMGKSAGNAPIELLCLYLDRYANKHYGISSILEIIDRHVSPFYTPPSWGYSVFYFLAAAQRCHPNYVAFLKSKGLSSAAAYTLLGMLEKEKRLSFDKAYIEEIFKRCGKELRHEPLPL